MLPLPKRKSNAPAGPVVPAWHPNFRDYEKLPDVKVVRTAFFFNVVAIVVVLALGIYFGKNEWQLRVINGQILQSQRAIDRDKHPSDQAVMQFKQYQTEAAKAEEVAAFVNSRPIVSDMLLHLARTLPENIALDGIELRANGVSLKLTVRGTPEAAAGYATAYLNKLRADQELTAFDRKKFEFTYQGRGASPDRLAVEFFLNLNDEYSKKP